LQDLAGPGEILVSETTVTELADSVDSIPGLVGLNPLKPLAIKGRKGQVVVYRAEFALPPDNNGK
jgi:class 3 adenylate cyclase